MGMTSWVENSPSHHEYAPKTELIVFAVAGLLRDNSSRPGLRPATNDGLALKKVLTTALFAVAAPWQLADGRRRSRSSTSNPSPMTTRTRATGAGCIARWLPTRMCWSGAVARAARRGRRRGSTRGCARGPQLLFVRADVRGDLADRRIPLAHDQCTVPDAWGLKIRPWSRLSTGNCTLQLSMHVPVPSTRHHVLLSTSTLLSAAYVPPLETWQTATRAS